MSEISLDEIDYFLYDCTAIPMCETSCELVKKGEHALIGISPFNGYFTYERINFIVRDDKVVILIEDNGKGIDSHINKEDLFIVDKDKKITKSGSGLGLPICKSIINHHDGDIYFKETEKGTAIEFFLPL